MEPVTVVHLNDDNYRTLLEALGLAISSGKGDTVDYMNLAKTVIENRLAVAKIMSEIS